MKEKITGYKWLTDDFRSRHGDEKWKIEEWKKCKDKIELCSSGFHACQTAMNSLNYVYGNRLVKVEAKGEIVYSDDKFVASEMRVVKELPSNEIMIRFAVACVKNTLFRFEMLYPSDLRPRHAIETVMLFLEGKATKEELWTAEAEARISVLKAEAEEAAVRAAESESEAESAVAAARAAVAAARAAVAAARAAGRASESAVAAARAAGRASESAAWSVAEAMAAEATTWVAEWSAKVAEKKWQEVKFERIIMEYIL